MKFLRKCCIIIFDFGRCYACPKENFKEMNDMFNFLAISAAEAYTLMPSDDGYWGMVCSTVVTGIAVVFLALAILIGFLFLMGAILGRKKKPKEEKTEATAVQSTPAPEAEIIEAVEEDDSEVIAVISAAIAAYSEADGKQYRITSVKKREKNQRSGWSAAGVIENTRGF